MNLGVVMACSLIAAQQGKLNVDFRYSPAWWQTAICLPDDPEKTLVGKSGELLFDFGSGPVRNFGIAIFPAIAGATWASQKTLSPMQAIVTTKWRLPVAETPDRLAETVDITEDAFVAIPETATATPKQLLSRIDGEDRLFGWVAPTRPCPPEFTGVDVGWHGKPIRLRLTVPKNSKANVVFGICEGYHQEAGKRKLLLCVEGAKDAVADPVQDFGFEVPGLYRLAGQDLNGDGVIEISVRTAGGYEDDNAILNALWAFQGEPPGDDTILSGKASAYAFYCGVKPPQRRTVIRLTLNDTRRRIRHPSPNSFAPVNLAFRIMTDKPVFERDGEVLVGPKTVVSASQPIRSCKQSGKSEWTLTLDPVELKPGEIGEVALTVDRNGSGGPPLTAIQAGDAAVYSAMWWEASGLPFDTVQVPDAGIQAMIESSVRNIWQAREIKGGKPAFQVGPTVYRGLWVVDGSFLLESAAILGRGKDARGGLEYLLQFQGPDGSFDLLGHYWKENGIVLWAATRHARLTQDKAWLRGQWPALRRVVHAIQDMRAKASKDPAAPNFGLLPGGQIDGGIGNDDKPEFSNTQWCLAGLKSAISAASWIGEKEDAASWQREYDSFEAAFRKAAQREMLTDSHGNRYVPTMIGNLGAHSPQKGQWAFCHAVYPGEVFAPGDPMAESQMAMLRATEREGMVIDTGWAAKGIWNYFASFYAHAALWMGHGDEACDMLYSFARHASPTRVWREEQMPLGMGDLEVGDMPHNWASAEFIRLTTHLIELDRGNELHLFEGLPRAWAGPGMETRLNGVLTPFGPLHLSLKVSGDRKSARLHVGRLSPCRIVVHLGSWAGTGRPSTLIADGAKGVDRTIHLR
ncbi:MAG: hypothetical protein ACHQ50_00115 [Fimbriimonadales bacterium]